MLLIVNTSNLSHIAYSDWESTLEAELAGSGDFAKAQADRPSGPLTAAAASMTRALEVKAGRRRRRRREV